MLLFSLATFADNTNLWPAQPFNEGEDEGHQEGQPPHPEGGEERMDVLEQAPPPQPEGPRPRTTTRYMTKYERARILGTRALQLRCRALCRALCVTALSPS